MEVIEVDHLFGRGNGPAEAGERILAASRGCPPETSRQAPGSPY
jgi:hypothetical protein